MTAPTTFEKYRDARSDDYCTPPTVDVPILPDVRHCAACRGPIMYDTARRIWAHENGPTGHRAEAHSKCWYCNSEDAVTHTQDARHEAIECSRCGGATGFAIGD